MRYRMLIYSLLTWPLLAALGCQMPGKPGIDPPAKALAPANVIDGKGYIGHWLVLGPFPNPTAKEALPDGTTRTGYGKDYLEPLGGEASAILTPQSAVDYIDEQGSPQVATAGRIEANATGLVNLDERFKLDQKVAYAFAYIRSDREQTREAFIGSDDCAKVWVNGDLMHAKWNEGGQSCQPRQDHFPIHLRKGLNPVLVKVEDNLGDWAFIMELPPQDEVEKIIAHEKRIQAIRDFQDVEIGPKERWGYLIRPGAFPELDWKQPGLVETLWGKMPLSVRWFDGQLNEVKTATAPGRYTAYVEAQIPDGPKIRRSVTVFCSEPGWFPWVNPPAVTVPQLSTETIDPAAWQEQQAYIADYAGQQFIQDLETSQEGAIFLAGLSELKPLGRPGTQLDLPPMRHQDYQLALKRKILGVKDDQFPKLQPPHKKSGPATTVLRAGDPKEAGVKPDAAQRIREVCQEWYDKSGDPCTVLVARHGVIVIHEAFGNTQQRPIDLETRFPLASLTKMFSGLLFAQFLDQGLIAADNPVGKYLPDFSTGTQNPLTLRHCLTHTSGLEGHGNWGGLNNPWLDNVIANGQETLRPGKVALYNGMGYDLAGKVMEMAAGKSIFRLFHEYIFIPLDFHNPTIVDMGYGLDCTVRDLATAGQLVLNKGSYGQTEFFSPETLEVLMPRSYEDLYPGLEPATWNYGIGLMWMRDIFPAAGKTDYDPGECILSKNAIGHGAASGAVLRIDLDNDLIVAMSRYQVGKGYGEYLPLFLQAVKDGLE